MNVISVTRSVYEFDPNTSAQILVANHTLNLSANVGIFALGTGAGSHGIAAQTTTIMNLSGIVSSREGSGISSAAGNHKISVAATGSVYGYVSGIDLEVGNNTIVNAGRISGGLGTAIDIAGGSNVITNTGVINSSVGAIFIVGTGNTVNNSGTLEVRDGFSAITMTGSVTNSGTIQGGSGVNFRTGSNSLNNSGSIFGNGISVLGNDAVDVVLNTGLIQSSGATALTLYGGNDVYDGRLGRAVGDVHGGDGNDTLLGGAFVDILRGDGDHDILNGGGGADFLDGGTNNDTYHLGADTSDTIGDASGIDTVTSTITRSLSWAFIENLVLQGTANINGTGNAAFNSIVGNGGNNLLAGQAGNDVLLGGGGNDQLFGQADKDNLTGGAGSDRFGFQTVAHTATGSGDVIVDLDDNGDDVIDLTAIIPGVLTFIGQGAFTAANQVRYQQVGTNVLVQINTTGPNGAEGEITLLNTTIGNGAIGQVNSADFLL